MLIATVSRPAVGTWTFEAQGRGLLSLSVRADIGSSPAGAGISLVDFDFVELGGRPGHGGLFERETPPRAGSEQLCRVFLSGARASASLFWISPSGERLGACEALSGSAIDELLFRCHMPSQPCRAVLGGRDASGAEFQRTWAPRIDVR